MAKKLSTRKKLSTHKNTAKSFRKAKGKAKSSHKTRGKKKIKRTVKKITKKLSTRKKLSTHKNTAKSFRKAKGKAKSSRKARGEKTVVKKAAKKEGKLIGTVTHYFPHVQASVIKMTSPLAIGETIKVKGFTTDLTQIVTSMQIDRVAITSAKKGDEIGLQVKTRVRQGDKVYKV